MRLPRLTAAQTKSIDAMTQMEGWRILRMSIEDNIKLKDAEINNFTFTIDDDGQANRKKVMEFQMKQHEVGVLKKFLQIVDNPAKVSNEADNDMYGEPDVIDKSKVNKTS